MSMIPPMRSSGSRPPGGTQPSPTLLPADALVRRLALVILIVPLLAIVLALVATHAAISTAANRLGDYGTSGGNSGNNPYPAYSYSYPADTSTTNDSGLSTDTTDSTDTSTDTSGLGTSTDTGTDTGSPTADASATTSPTTGPAATVEAYFAAINAQQYQTAWNLGGQNLGESYSTFESGFSNTSQDTVTIASVQGDVVTASLSAVNKDGSTQTFSGTYTVTGNEITTFQVQQTG